jgi:hypothetical protein
MGVMQKAFLAAAAVLVVSCASQPNAGISVTTREGTVQVLDDIYHLTRAAPDWVFLESAEIERAAEYEGRYVFRAVSTGTDLVGRQRWAKDFLVSADLARFVGVRLRDSLEDAAAGDLDTLQPLLENVAHAASERAYPGARVATRYWWQLRTAGADGGTRDIYEYYVLFTVDRPQVDAVIMRAFEENDRNAEAGTGRQREAWERVKRVMESKGL